MLYEHEAVQGCVAASAPDPKRRERVQAVAVLKADHATTGEELIQHCKKRLAEHRCPKKNEIRDQLPKAPVGKILKRDVKKHFWKGHKKQVSQMMCRGEGDII